MLYQQPKKVSKATDYVHHSDEQVNITQQEKKTAFLKCDDAQQDVLLYYTLY